MGFIVLWLILALVIGLIAEGRTIGFLGGFFLSLLLSPLIGLIIALLSKTKTQAAIETGLLNKLSEAPQKNFDLIETKLKKIEDMKANNLISENESKLMRNEVLKG
ncbi:hypothetical protein [Ferruginibacter sp.]